MEIDLVNLYRILEDVQTHYLEVLERHPEFSDGDSIHGAGIVAEEAGELCQAANDYHYTGRMMADTGSMRLECLDVIVAAIRMIESIDKGDYYG